MHAGIDFRMPAGRLWHTVKRGELREDDLQGAAGAQRLEEYVGTGLTERALGLLPDSLRYERRKLTGIGHFAHQGDGFLRNAKPQLRITSGKPRDAQDANGILDEGVRYMSQQPRLEILAPAVRIDELARGG